MKTHFSRHKSGFSLIEILVVVALLALLAALLFPAFAASREKARASSCLENYHQIGVALHLYAQDSDDLTPVDGGSFSGIIQDCAPYTHSSRMFICPDDDDYVAEGRAGSYRMPSLYQGLPISGGWQNPYVGGQAADVATTTLTYEAEQDFVSAPIIPTYRHGSGTQALYFDGHARWRPK